MHGEHSELHSTLTALCVLQVRLLDARFLVILARLGGKLPRRQDLPDAAFVTLPKLKRIYYGGGSTLPITCVSHPWLQPDHPDPYGDNLRLVASALEATLEFFGGTYDIATHGVFVDFGSLCQKGAAGEERSPHTAPWTPGRATRAALISADPRLVRREALAGRGEPLRPRAAPALRLVTRTRRLDLA